jgi:Domain of unknown function (DUF4352)
MKKLLYLAVSVLVLASCGGKKSSEGADVALGDGKERHHANTKTDLGVTAKVPYFESSADVKVNYVVMDFWPSSGTVLSDPQETGKQFVKVNMTVTSTEAAKDYYFSSTNFNLKGADGKENSESFLVNSSNVTDTVGPNKELKKGESYTFSVYYETSNKDKVDDLSIIASGTAMKPDMSTEDKKVELKFKK